MGALASESRILAASPSGDILEIAFSGDHEWTHGNEMASFIRQALSAHPAVAVVINLLAYEYTFGNDVSGLFEAFMDRKLDGYRPACIVASGKTYQSLHRLMEPTQMLELLPMETSVEDALHRLTGQLQDSGGQ